MVAWNFQLVELELTFFLNIFSVLRSSKEKEKGELNHSNFVVFYLFIYLLIYF